MNIDELNVRKIRNQLDAIEESLYAIEELLLELRNITKPTLDMTQRVHDAVLKDES